MMSSLSMLLLKDRTWIWDIPQQRAFDDVNEQLHHLALWHSMIHNVQLQSQPMLVVLGLVVPYYRNMMECTSPLHTSQEP